jgi:UDP-GlcNAc:undecaprenyl-phosphate/decaprenyl-phosphate GlcNAc-1-phosphate transferase
VGLHFLAFAACFGVTLLAMLALRPLAIAVNLLDRPGGRKTHHGDVPIVGGLAMFIGLAFGAGLVPFPGQSGVAVLSAAALLVVVGLLDDRFDLSPWARLPLQLVAPLIVLGSIASTSTLSLGNPLGLGEIVFAGWTAAAVVVILVAGAVNAFNMMDGMDGLAGAVALVACIGIACLSAVSNQAAPLALSLIVSATICAFLVFNLPIQANRSIRCFMGDAGSTLLGFLLALMCLEITQVPAHRTVSPMSVLWVVAMPIYELLWTIIRRVSRGQSPFRPDREHLHHLLLDAGISVRVTFLVYVAISGALATVGIVVDSFEVSDLTSFACFVCMGLVTVFLLYRAPSLARSLPSRMQRLPGGPDVN